MKSSLLSHLSTIRCDDILDINMLKFAELTQQYHTSFGSAEPRNPLGLLCKIIRGGLLTNGPVPQPS